ncbi:MAG TPA: hypothetical protein VK601_19225, partial [Kofleriaceae bacterium]|nr:hypothetical protein [Kofleriaceae bacterium]
SARLEPSVTPPYVGTIESLWGPDGAVCLDRPRLAAMSDVEAVCKPPPPCNGLAGVAGWEKQVHVISANPRCPP